jgi:hypothetical protein
MDSRGRRKRLVHCGHKVKFFTYFLYFPKQQLIYFGKGTPGRYRNTSLGGLFTGPHHNPDVEKALLIEPAIWSLHQKYETLDQAAVGEQNYLSLYWESGEWNDRPKWMLNRSNKSVGGSFPAQLEGVYRSMKDGAHNFFTEEGRELNRQRAIQKNKQNNLEHNRSPLMRAVTLANNSVRCCCLECGKECSRPGMGRHLQTHK